MTELRTKILLTVAITFLLAHSWVAAQSNERPKPPPGNNIAGHHSHDSKTKAITWSVPMCIFFVIIAVGIGLVYVLYRAHSGSLCCLKPKMRYRPQENDESSDAESGGYHELVCHTPPPTYESAYPSNEYPPDYRDALQDVIVNDSYLPYSTNYAPPVQGEMASSSDVQTDFVVTPATGEHESPVSIATSPESASRSDSNSACDSRSHSCECPPYESISTNDFASCPNRIPSSNDASPTATVQALSMPTPPELDTDTEKFEADSFNVVTPANSACTEHWTGDLSPGRVSRCSFYQSEETTSSPVATKACTGSDLEDRVDIAVQCQETQSLISAGREEH